MPINFTISVFLFVMIAMIRRRSNCARSSCRQIRHRSTISGRNSIGPAPESIRLAGFGGLRPPNPAGRIHPGAGPIDFRPGTIDRLLRGLLQSHQSVHLLTPTVTVGHFGSYFLSTRRGPRVVPHPATFKINVAGRPGGTGGGPGGANFPPRASQDPQNL